MGFFKNFTKALTNPQTLVTAAAATYFSGGALTFSAFATRAATTAALTAATQSLAAKPKTPQFSDFAFDSTGRTQMVKQPITNRRAVYGEVRVSGTLAFIESTDNDQFLHLIVLLASHEVNQIGTVYLNDEALTLDGSGNVTAPSKYANLVRVKKHLGTADQSADSDLVSESDKWTTGHRLRGIAYVYVRLKFDADAFPNGIPNISAKVQGKKVYDPRTSTTAYSTNPALVIRDYLLDSTYGFGATISEIDDTAITTAANICEESISLSGGGTENRYTLNGTVDSGTAPKQVLEDLLSSCGGVITYQNGTFTLKAAKYVTPTVTLSETALRGAYSLQTRRSRRDNYNAVKGVFTPPETNFVPTDYPAYKSSVFIAEDNNDTIYLDYDLAYTTSSPMAQRLAKIALYRNRQQLMLAMPCNLNAFNLKVGDTVSITLDRLGFSSKVFEVAEWSLNIETGTDGAIFGVDLALRELNSEVFDWSAEEAAFQLDNTILPNPFDLPAAGLAVSDELQVFNEKAVSVLIANVSSSSVYAKQFEVQAKKSSDTDYISLGVSSSTKFELVDVEDGVNYDVRARIINGLGVRSPFTTVTHQVVGKTAPPQDVTNFAVNIIGTEAHLSWTPVTDLDLSHYRVRHSPRTTGALFSNATDLAAKVSRPANTVIVPAMTGTYFIVAVDKLGNQSNNPTSTIAVITAAPELSKYHRAATQTEHPSFSGTKTNTVAVGSELILDTSVNFDSVSGDFDDALGAFDGGAGNVAASGTYDFASYVDLGSKFTSRISARLLSDRRDYVNNFDDASGLFDDRLGLFDGEAAVFGNVDAQLFVSTTDDDPAGSPTWSAYRKFDVGDYTARALRFRAELTTEDDEATPVVTELQVTVDIPDRVISEADIASGAGTKVVTFSPVMHTIEGIGISAQNLSSGDYYAITNKTASGFSITFYDSGDNAISRTFDYVAKGYGEAAA
jgi:hypothetical protein